MVTYDDAQYILAEIKRIPYYEGKLARLKKRITEIEERIATATAPASPGGGDDVLINGKKVRVKVPGNHNYDSGKAITELITMQGPLEASQRDFEKRCKTAHWYKKTLLKRDETGFTRDFLEGVKSYKQLQNEYGVSNAYDRMIRIVRGAFRSI